MKKVFTMLVLLAFVGWSYAQVTFWGTTNTGGSGTHDTGTIFTILLNGSSYNEVQGLGGVNGLNGWDLTYVNNDMVQGANGLFYSKNESGGANRAGNIFSINPTTNAYNVVYSFPSTYANTSGMMLATNGKMYGNINLGGTYDFGYIFSLDTLGNLTDLFDYGPFFATGVGYFSVGSFVQANNGLLYGMTGFGGANSSGAIFSFNPATVSDFSPPTVIHSFAGGTSDGGNSLFNPTLIQGSDGLLYGMTTEDGANSKGVVFCCDLNGNNYRIIYSFTGTPGGEPVGSFVQGPNGLLYGMDNNDAGVSGQYGALFSIDTNRLNPTPYTTLQAFTSSNQNPGSNGDVYLASDGNLYGYTIGTTASPLSAVVDATMWEYNLTSHAFSTLYTFSYASGTNPNGKPQEVRSLPTTVSTTLCQGSAISIPFTAIGLYQYDNTFTAQLSNASGSFSSPTTLGTLSGTKGGTISATLPSGANGSGYKIRIVSSDPNFTGAAVSVVINDCWQGGTASNDWATGTNWLNGVAPTNACATGVSIPVNGNNPIINSAVSIGNITITGTGRELITLNNTLTLCGNWTDNSGTSSDATGNQVILDGASAQTLSGNLSFDQLAIASTGGGISLAASTTIFINTSLLLQTGNINTTGGTLTLNSTSVTQAAIIDNFSGASSPGTGTITGSVTAQRFYGSTPASNDFSQHMIGSPVSGLTAAALGSTNASSAQYQPYTGNAPHHCDELISTTTTPYGKVFSYVEANASSCTMSGWMVDASSTSLAAGTGYSVVVGAGSGTLSLTGTANLGTSYNVPTTNSDYANTTSDQGRSYPSGINLVSNPYSASLNVSSLNTANSTNFSGATVYVWDVTSGAYDMNPTTIAPFQAFKVIQSSGGASNYTIPGSARTTTAGTFQRAANPVELNMTITNNSTGLIDNTIVGFNTNSTAQFNPSYDVIKLPGAVTRHTMYTLNSNYWLAINTLKSINETSTVPVGFEPGASGTYTANFSGLNSFDPTSYVTLEDVQTGTMFDVRSGDYTFTSDATNDSWNRFVLHFTPPASITSTNATCSEQGMINIVQPGTANWTYTIADVNNITLSSGTLNANSPVITSVPAGVYTLTLVDNNGYTVVKSVQVNGVQSVTASFTVSANAVNVNQEVTLTSTAAAAAINDWNFGDGTTGYGATVSHIYSSEGVYNVTLNSASASGCTSSASNTITVTRSVTGVTNLNDISNILIWSNENMVNIDFSQLTDVQANIQIYNILGQKLSEDKYVTSTIYHKEIPNIEEGYIVVSVKNNDGIISKKLFISNLK